MAFIEGTQIFTDSGFKKIEDIGGHDKVLVRNFIGDAELIQPFALKRTQYTGEVIKIGAKDWSFTTTPDHLVVYDDDKYAQGVNFKKEPAKSIVSSKNKRIYRKFKYIFSDDPKKETIRVRDEFGTRTVSISPQDWYKLIGYVLMRGFIRMKPGKPMLFLFLEEDRLEEEVTIIGDILDRLTVSWHVQYSSKTRPKIVVSSKNTLVARLVTRLGSNKRKSMHLPDKMLYSSSKELTAVLIDTIIDASIKPDTERGNVYQIATTNTKLIDSLTVLGTLGGYSIRSVLRNRAGEQTPHGITKKDGYIIQISAPIDTYQPKYVKKLQYSGSVYEIDLFDGQVYAREGSKPVWVNPK